MNAWDVIRTVSDAAKGLASLIMPGRGKQEGARYLRRRELRRLLRTRHTGLLIDGKSGRLSEAHSFQNVCVVARVWAGKTSRFIIPNVLDRAKSESSIVVNDPKGEVFEATAGHMQRAGFRVVVIDPEDLTRSARFNPLLEAKTDIELEQVAEILIRAGSSGSQKDAFWDHGAIRLVCVLLKLLRRSSREDAGYFTLWNLYRLLQHFGSDWSPLDDFAITWAENPNDPDDRSLFDEWKGATTGNPQAVQSFALTALTALRAFTNRNMVELTASSSFELGSIRQQKTIVYQVIPAQHAEYYGFWTSLFFRSVFNACMRRMPIPWELPVYVLFDEFGHATLPGFVSVANTIRGYRVSLSIILQSISQLSARYGQDYAKSIQGGFNSYLTYSGSDPETARFFEGLSGRVIEHQEARDEHETARHHEHNLLNADSIRRIWEDEAILISGNRHPARLRTTPYFKSGRFRSAAKQPPEVQREIRATDQVKWVPIFAEKLDWENRSV